MSCVAVLFFYSVLFYFCGDLGICFCHKKLVSEPGSLFCKMATVKFEVEKFNGHNSFSLWHIKMQALLRQQGLAKVLKPQEEKKMVLQQLMKLWNVENLKKKPTI